MRVEYYPSEDMLSIMLYGSSYTAAGAESTADRDLTVHYDEDGRIAEIEIEHASQRVDLEAMRRHMSFEEVDESRTSAP